VLTPGTVVGPTSGKGIGVGPFNISELSGPYRSVVLHDKEKLLAGSVENVEGIKLAVTVGEA
jgi:hypothetical protein